MKTIQKYIIAKKLNMSQIFDKNGAVCPVTIVKIPDISISQVKTKEKDGYTAIQVNSNKIKKEFRTNNIDRKIGDTIDLSQFKEGDNIEVTGISKGKGFQGVVKRHGFAGGPRTHGQKHSEREPGSIGGGLRNKVPKRMRMAGRMGGDRVTVKNLQVVHIDSEKKMMYISGAIPGKRGSLIEIKA